MQESEEYQGKSFWLPVRCSADEPVYPQYKAIYDDARFNRVQGTIQTHLSSHGCLNNDPATVLEAAIGFQPTTSVSWNIPPLDRRNELAHEATSSEMVFNCFFKKDLDMIVGLLHIVFAAPDTVAKNSVSSVSEISLLGVKSFCYNLKKSSRTAVLIYIAGNDEKDSMQITIEGQGDGPNAFIFEPSEYWKSKRYTM